MWAVPEKHIINFFWPYWHKQKEVKSKSDTDREVELS